MSFNSKDSNKHDNMDQDKMNLGSTGDDFNIKSHLNASLELEGISVSEDLIKKTMEAIKQQENGKTEDNSTTGPQVKKDNRTLSGKAAPWMRYARIIAGTAAAVFVLTVGMNLITGNKNGIMNNDTASPQMTQGDKSVAMAPSITSAADGTTSTDTGSEAAPEAKLFSTKDSTLEDNSGTEGNNKSADGQASSTERKATDQQIAQNKSAATSGGSTSDTSGEGASTGKADTSKSMKVAAPTNSDSSEKSASSKKQAVVVTDVPTITTSTDTSSDLEDSKQSTASSFAAANLNFQDIVGINPEEIQNITITDEITKNVVILSNQSEIQEFYEVMNQQKFTQGTQQAATSINYTIKITTKQDVICTITVGDIITVSSSDGDTNTENYYKAVDEKLLYSTISSYFQKYIQ